MPLEPPPALSSWLELVVLLGAAFAAIGVLWHRYAIPAVRGAVREAIAPEIARLERIEKTVDRELSTDGGASMKDQLTRLTITQTSNGQRLDRIERRLDGIESRQ